MGPSTTKKVLVSRFDRETLAGFVSPQTYLQPAGLELLSQSGNVQVLPYEDVKAVYFVRDFKDGEPKAETRLFASRPKMDGLWVRMRFRDNDVMDGVLSGNLLSLEPSGFTVTPPDPGYQNRRMFVPRAALLEVKVLGVMGGAATSRKQKAPTREQLEMFQR